MRDYRVRWSPFKVKGDGGLSKNPFGSFRKEHWGMGVPLITWQGGGGVVVEMVTSHEVALNSFCYIRAISGT